MMMAPAVRKAEMMGFDSMLHRNPSRSAPNTRYRIATNIVTCTIQHSPVCPQQQVLIYSLGQKAASPTTLQPHLTPSVDENDAYLGMLSVCRRQMWPHDALHGI